MYPTLKGSQETAIAASIDPQSATAVQYSVWVDFSKYGKLLAIVQLGAIGTSLDAKIQQAQDNAGTGVKDLSPAKAITQLTVTGSRQALIDIRPTDLDYQNATPFTFVRLALTPVAATLLGGLILGLDPRFGVGSDQNAATVAQVV